jgi:hypothetical protein
MNFTFVFLFLSLSFFTTISSSLVISKPIQKTVRRQQRAAAATSIPPEEMLVERELLLEVRSELVQKYLDQGVSRTKAEREVDYFLSEPSRSRDYLEMRKYSQEQKEEGLGIDLFLSMQFLAAFALGFAGHGIHKAIEAVGSAYSDHAVHFL